MFVFVRRFRPIAVVGFVVSVVALAILIGFTLAPSTRPYMIAQYSDGWHVHPPIAATIVVWVFMILNVPATLLGELVVRTLLAAAPPATRALGDFVVWMIITPIWWWFIGRVNYHPDGRPAESTETT